MFLLPEGCHYGLGIILIEINCPNIHFPFQVFDSALYELKQYEIGRDNLSFFHLDGCNKKWFGKAIEDRLFQPMIVELNASKLHSCEIVPEGMAQRPAFRCLS